MGEPKRKYEAHPESAPGDFYVMNGDCMSCGAPQAVAPDLIGRSAANDHCIWKKQPETPEELEQAFAAFHAACCDPYRYAGSDPEIMGRIMAYSDQVENHKELAIQAHWNYVTESIRRHQQIRDGDE